MNKKIVMFFGIIDSVSFIGYTIFRVCTLVLILYWMSSILPKTLLNDIILSFIAYSSVTYIFFDILRKVTEEDIL